MTISRKVGAIPARNLVVGAIVLRECTNGIGTCSLGVAAHLTGNDTVVHEFRLTALKTSGGFVTGLAGSENGGPKFLVFSECDLVNVYADSIPDDGLETSSGWMPASTKSSSLG